MFPVGDEGGRLSRIVGSDAEPGRLPATGGWANEAPTVA